MNGAITDSEIQNNDQILKAKYLLNNNHIRIPEGTNLKKGDRVNFHGSLEGIDGEGMMIVQVDQGMYEDMNNN
ncbi:hypothetical protein PGT21_020978 [Puccinia graminis f. sp. tritici]|uniref:Uncharacterized protein n=1 Tax=Puccinia graminis f. sp. tritici TaxID=56615 RepID=A0A5B0P2T4_PUCGR|nr:hypothetical protein PGTUg99_015781 [Puccinia graminis f. sp. tritici]KAA1084556.1 hypothetical protein PGT21_030691 [Puccinia graminis f. sp. tritici]KAA1094359.1 hypothetical protein PGT21_019024 [Puccinia graminis f. sp. tritici]KAA1099211.1 hypothetical protein PGTUg99_022391 [Puccinia graminis f. sp. tritici]KAA1099848.1 hypothetical protein PGT21_022830 [Puccinia graminis f. sp. tritici]